MIDSFEIVIDSYKESRSYYELGERESCEPWRMNHEFRHCVANIIGWSNF